MPTGDSQFCCQVLIIELGD